MAACFANALRRTAHTQNRFFKKHSFALVNWRCRTNYRKWNDTLNIDFDIDTKGTDFPKQPEKDFVVMSFREYNDTKEEITNAVSILKMTDEPYVNASTVKSIARYL